MKAIFTFALMLLTTIAFAQNPMFVHTTTAGNSSGNVTYIDHPDLNGDPDARIVVSHNWNPSDGTGVYNDQATGVWYDSGPEQWTIFNEDLSNITPDSSYNVYITPNVTNITHIATLANQGVFDSYSVVNHPLLNGNPDAYAVLTTYWNPNSVYNDTNYAFWYDDPNNRWIIFTEDLSMIPLDSAFIIAVGGAVVQGMKHTANAGNISGNYTVITHPLLDGDPDAVFVYTHNWGASGEPSNVIVDNATGAWYTGTNWSIFTEDNATAMPDGAEFDLLIFDETLGVGDNVIEGLTYYPNPVQDVVTIRTNEPIISVSVYNILGQEMTTVAGETNQIEIDFSSYATGNYFAKVIAGDGIETVKLIKQ